ncbi:MAG: hypothetical protein OEY38_15425, partial [Gammaproteobacteria bacterium]|nr:hypothetical protein [Gammaproteobacteria bacterium]
LSDITGINRVYDLHAHVAGENLILFIDDNDTPVLVEDGGLTPISINIPPDYYDYLALDGKLFFSETRQSPGSSTRFESSIVQTDGSQDGTTIVKTVENKYISFVSYRSFDGITFYIEETDDEEANYQWQLFQFDGVNHQAITGLPISSRIKEYVRNDNNAYVTLFADNNDPARDSQIWKISSNFQASLLVEIICTQQAAQPQQLELINNKLFFNAFTDSFGREPWVSDGSPDGTHMLLDVRPGSESSIELD